MKYKIKYEKSNLVFMTSVIILCLITCVFWFILKEYNFCAIYFFLTLILAHIYYFTYYYLNEKKLVIKLGFIRFKIKYSSILKVENKNAGIKLFFKYMSMTIYPCNKDVFFSELINKVKGI